jgi:hypothetical protein
MSVQDWMILSTAAWYILAAFYISKQNNINDVTSEVGDRGLRILFWVASPVLVGGFIVVGVTVYICMGIGRLGRAIGVLSRFTIMGMGWLLTDVRCQFCKTQMVWTHGQIGRFPMVETDNSNRERFTGNWRGHACPNQKCRELHKANSQSVNHAWLLPDHPQALTYSLESDRAVQPPSHVETVLPGYTDIT